MSASRFREMGVYAKLPSGKYPEGSFYWINGGRIGLSAIAVSIAGQCPFDTVPSGARGMAGLFPFE